MVAASSLTILPKWLPILWLWVNVVAQPLDYARCKNKNHWHSIDAPLTLILGGSGIMTTNITNKGGQYFEYGLLPLHSSLVMQEKIPKIVDAPLMLILGGSDIVNNNIANQGCEYFGYGLLLLHSPWIIQDARPSIIDALLMLILRMWQRLCCCLFCLYRVPIRWLCLTASKSLPNYLTYKTKNCWCSVDTQFRL